MKRILKNCGLSRRKFGSTMFTSATYKTEEKGVVVSPSIDSGFGRRQIPIAVGLLGLTILYTSLMFLLKDSVR
jgi:hypothetical protein